MVAEKRGREGRQEEKKEEKKEERDFVREQVNSMG